MELLNRYKLKVYIKLWVVSDTSRQRGRKMILKLKQNDSWRFIDNVLEVVVEDKLDKNDTFIQYVKNNEHVNQSASTLYLSHNVSEGCYILNDSGKTVEKVC